MQLFLLALVLEPAEDWSLLKNLPSVVPIIVNFRGFFDYCEIVGIFNLNLFFLVSNFPFMSYLLLKTFYERIPVL